LLGEDFIVLLGVDKPTLDSNPGIGQILAAEISNFFVPNAPLLLFMKFPNQRFPFLSDTVGALG
jgi:hypothetical protein